MSLHAFLDESRRGCTYLVAVVILRPRELDPARSAMRRLAKPGQRRVHFNDEGDRRRKEILARISELGLRGRVWFCRHNNDVAARQACLSGLVPRLVELSVTRLVLESCQHQDARDRTVLSSALRAVGSPLAYDHLRPTEDPLLWASDAIAWCYGAGGEWRRRVELLLDEATDLDRP